MKYLLLVLLITGTGWGHESATVKNHRSLNLMSQSVPVRVEGMVNCAIIGIAPQIVTLRCSNDVYVEFSKRKWPDVWERVFKLDRNFAAMYERRPPITARSRPVIRPIESPPLHVNGPCPARHKEGESAIKPSNCIVTP